MPGPKSQLNQLTRLTGHAMFVVVLVAYLLRGSAYGEPFLESPPEGNQISISADISHEWKDEQTSVYLLRGHCRIVQGDVILRAQKMVVWQRVEKSSRRNVDRVDVYLEDDVHIDRPEQSLNLSSGFVSLRTPTEVTFEIRRSLSVEPATHDGLFQRAIGRRSEAKRSTLLQTQMVVQTDGQAGPELQIAPAEPQAERLRRVRIFSRNRIPHNIFSFESKESTPPEQVWVLTGGIRMLFDGLEEYDLVDLAADRMVIWTQSRGKGGFRGDPGETLQSSDTPFTVYLEGNIVIRQGDNKIYATHATYDARDHRALYHNAQLRTYVPQLKSDLRIRAERVRQHSQDSFHAQQAWTTGSKFGVPGYRMRSSDIFLENRYSQPWIGTGPEQFDPTTGAPLVKKTPWITSLNNTFLVEEIPLLYTPHMSAPADDPNIPLQRITVEYDRIFGGQLKTVWDTFQILGLDEPDGTTWHLMADHYTKRGPAFGTWGKYRGSDWLQMDDHYQGEGTLFYVQDNGKDNLGRDRRALEPDVNDRYIAQWRHRHELSNGMRIFGELGLLSDRNFLEQYYENEFDEDKDVESLLAIQQTVDNWSWELMGRPRLNSFSTTTEWLPRGDLYALSEPLFGGLLTWSSHTSAGYANLRPGDAPIDPADIYTALPYVANIDGSVFMTRHELNAPFSLGPLHVVPYALGEGAFWSEDLSGDEIDRFVGIAGVRSSLLFWRVFPYVQSRPFNLNGLAHKVLFEIDYSYTESTESLDAIPQYNEIDDNAQERFRNRLVMNTFGGMLPTVFKPRQYAVRTGAGRYVTTPYHELIDDQQVARFAIRQRLQTKEGPPDQLRTKDWMTFDFETSFFPDADRDNFGEDIGLIGGRYRWNVGARTSILANAQYDLFDNAQELWSLGILSQRSKRGSAYLGVRQVKGAGLDSQIASLSYSYQMGPKWISTFGTSYDLAERRNRGQSFTVTRVGADFLIHVGASFDESKDNAGIAIAIEPRFAPRNNSPTKLGSLLGGRQTNR